MLELPPAGEAVVSSLCIVSFTASNSSMSLEPCALVPSAPLQNHSFGCFVKSQAADDCEHLKRAQRLARAPSSCSSDFPLLLQRAHLKPRLFYITVALPRSKQGSMTAVEICPLNAPGDFTVQIIA